MCVYSSYCVICYGYCVYCICYGYGDAIAVRIWLLVVNKTTIDYN